jgi:hypothetical protein
MKSSIALIVMLLLVAAAKYIHPVTQLFRSNYEIVAGGLLLIGAIVTALAFSPKRRSEGGTVIGLLMFFAGLCLLAPLIL